MAVNDFVSLLLGEAGGKTATERYNDMLHIASVVVNRSLATGLPVEDIIANSNEFNAWGKAIPAGNEKYRSIAEQAIKQVTDFGPVTSATFYATPEKTENLPPRLADAVKTKSHEFFTDPENRSIGVVGGRYARVSPVSVETTPPVPLTAPRPYSPGDMRMMAFDPPYANLVPPTVAGQRELTPGAGLANLTPNAPRFELGGRRSEIPSSGIAQKVADAAGRVAPGTTAVIYSGQERVGQAPVNAPNRHPRGYAGDFYFERDGRAVTDQDMLKDFALEMAARHNANIGYSNVPWDNTKSKKDNQKAGYYMGPERVHIDTMPLDQFPGGSVWGKTAKGWGADLNFARESGIGALPNWYSPNGIPTPTPRDTGLNLPSVPTPAPSLPNFSGGMSPRAAQQSSMAMYGLGLPPVPPPPAPIPYNAKEVHIPGSFPVPSFPKDFVPRGPSLPNYPGISPWATSPMTSLGMTIAEYLGFGPEEAKAPNFAGGKSPRSAQEISVNVPAPPLPSVPQAVKDAYVEYGRSRAAAPPTEFPVLPAVAPVPAPVPMELAAPDLPVAAPIPTPAPRNSEAAFLGGLMGPATKQIGQNIKSNFRGQPINPFAGIPQAYRDAFRGLGNRMNGLFGGSLPPPTPFSVGRGMSAIGAVRGGGMAPGATAYSNSHPGASWSTNAYGFPEFTSQHGFTGRTPDGF